MALLKKTLKQGLKFKVLDLRTVKVIIATDASFANARGNEIQLRYIDQILDEEGTSNIFHYGSNSFKFIEMSVMAAEVQALVLGFYF